MNMNLIAHVASSLRSIAGGKTDVRKHLTEFMAAEECDYPLLNERYLAFEQAAVSFLRRQDIVEPNHITYFRFAVCLVLLLSFSRLSYVHILILSILGALSDFFDGAFARSASKKTRLGVLIDPLADKLLIFTVMYILLMKKALDPMYVLAMVLLEGHIVIVPILSWFYSNRGDKDARRRRGDRDHDKVFERSRPMFLGRVKVHLYSYAIFSLMIGKAFDVLILLKLGNWFLLLGICAAAIAFSAYIIKYFLKPYSIS
jgi:phosphatidylglycerophosphate synthase